MNQNISKVVGRVIKFVLILLGFLSIPMSLALGVELNVKDSSVVMDNGICAVTLSNPEGIITQIQYQGTKNLLEGGRNNGGGYYDIVWNKFGNTTGNFDVIKGEKFKIINQTDEHVEVSFSKIWNFSMEGVSAPVNIDKRFIMLNNSSGFYSYAIFEHPKEYPDFVLGEARMAFKLNKTKFHYMAVADDIQREMPSAFDRLNPNAVPLAYPEAVLLKNPIEKEFKGEVDDKYQYSKDNKDIRVHGWIGRGEPAVGFWQITPSNEFRSGGPLKQSLTSHVGPTTLATFLSSHYVGNELSPRFDAGESWKKVYGPVFIYLNSASATKEEGAYSDLWQDAKNQMVTEVQKWPYDFPASEDFLHSDQRGKVSGRLFVFDSDTKVPASHAYIGLAAPGEKGSWQWEFKGYQFWTTTNETGYFSIDHVRPGDYNLYAWVPGFIGDYRYDASIISITAGADIVTGEIVYQPPRSGPTLWEIGYPDRLAAEFNVPDPNPMYVNKLYVNHTDKFRQYGLWERYSELYPDTDLVYTIGESNPATDWFFAHVPRKTAGNRLSDTTWQIRFHLDRVDYRASYKLRIALASANFGELHVRVNNPYTIRPMFRSGMMGRDNVIARHGIHGLHRLYDVTIPGIRLWRGENVIYMTQPRSSNLFQGFLYDYIRLEGPCFDYY